MTSLASFSKLACVTCAQVTLHNASGCIHCKTPRPPNPCIARDITAYTFGQTPEAVARRLTLTGELSRTRNTKPEPMKSRRIYTERPGTQARDYAVIQHLANGLTSKAEIARKLEISAQGVWPIIKRAYKRLAIPLPAVGDNDHSVLIATARVRGLVS